MLKSTLMIVMIGALLILTACGSRVSPEQKPSIPKQADGIALHAHAADPELDPDAMEEETSAETAAVRFDFPPSASLSFKPVERKELVEMELRPSWEHTRTVSIGTLEGQTVSLALYKETEPGQLCSADYERAGLLEYNQATYYYDGCFSGSPGEESSSESDYIWVPLGYEHEDANAHLIVHGAAELSGNGPGRKLYLLYDALAERWYGFENWGTPKVVDLDEDGAMELVNQFEGLHMQFPDVDLYRWNESVLEQSLSVKNALMLPYAGQSIAKLDEAARLLRIRALTSLEPNAWDHPAEAGYIYRDGQVFRSEAGGE